MVNQKMLLESEQKFRYIDERKYRDRTYLNGCMIYILKAAARVAEISKKIHPHLLRHSRLDFLGRQGFRERDLKIFAGWSKDSKMANTYLHYDVEEVEKKLLALKGIRQVEETALETTFKPVICAACSKENTPTAMYCACCHLLAEGRRELADNTMNKLFEHPEFKELVKRLLAEEMRKNSG